MIDRLDQAKTLLLASCLVIVVVASILLAQPFSLFQGNQKLKDKTIEALGVSTLAIVPSGMVSRDPSLSHPAVSLDFSPAIPCGSACSLTGPWSAPSERE